MTYSIRYQRRASNEYESATNWYSEKSDQASINFSLAIQERINLLKLDPLRFGKRYKEFREVAVKRYPYNIVYMVDEKENVVTILSFFHHKRNPKTKYKRLG